MYTQQLVSGQNITFKMFKIDTYVLAYTLVKISLHIISHRQKPSVVQTNNGMQVKFLIFKSIIILNHLPVIIDPHTTTRKVYVFLDVDSLGRFHHRL
jgi:hypothetical protein